MVDEINGLKMNIQEMIDPKDEIDFKEIFEEVQKPNNTKIPNRLGKKVKKIALTEQQRNELLSILSCNPKTYACYVMAVLQMTTGMREGEICNITFQQINFEGPFIQIEPRNASKYAKAWKPKTESSIRQVYIPSDTLQTLKTYCATVNRTNRKTGYIFLSRKHTPYDVRSYARIVNKAAKQCKSIGFAIGTHAFRRTFISYNVAKKIDLGFISKSVGHSTVKTTMIYMKSIQDFENIKEFNKTMNAMVKAKKGEN